jgi:hypothetical protein
MRMVGSQKQTKRTSGEKATVGRLFPLDGSRHKEREMT